MIMPGVYELGKMVVMELNFPSLPDSEIKVGQWIILWEEIPVRKIGENIYEVYPDAEPYDIETMEERLEKIAEGFKFIDMIDKPLPCIKPPIVGGWLSDDTRYVRRKKGSVKRNPWESPRFFG